MSLNVSKVLSLFDDELRKREIRVTWIRKGDPAEIGGQACAESVLVVRSSAEAPLTEEQVADNLALSLDFFRDNRHEMTARGLIVQEYATGLILYMSVGFKE